MHRDQDRKVLKSHHKKGSERKDERINIWQIHGSHSLVVASSILQLLGFLVTIGAPNFAFWLHQTHLTKGMSTPKAE